MIQPVDVLPDGRQDMCDACPDQTVWHDRLVWSCRLEEPMEYGDFLRTRRLNLKRFIDQIAEHLHPQAGQFVISNLVVRGRDQQSNPLINVRARNDVPVYDRCSRANIGVRFA